MQATHLHQIHCRNFLHFCTSHLFSFIKANSNRTNKHSFCSSQTFMGDRRPSFFRALLSSVTSNSRRKPAATKPAAATTTAAPATEPKNDGQITATAAAPVAESKNDGQPIAATTTTAPATESKTDGQSTAAATTFTTPTLPATSSPPVVASLSPLSEPQKAEQVQPTPPPPSKLPSTKEQMATKNNQTPTSSPSRVTTPSPSSRQPSNSSPRASSPSLLPSSQTPQPRSLKQASSNTPKGVKPSPSKELKSLTKEEISSSHEAPTSTSIGKGTTAAASQTKEGSQPKAEIRLDSANSFNDAGMKPTKEGSQPKAEIKSDSAKGFHDMGMKPTTEGSQPKEELKSDSANGFDDIKPSNSSELENTTTAAPNPVTTTSTKELEPSTINKEHKPSMEINDKDEEIKEVKEVVQELDTESNGESKEEMHELLPPKSCPAEEIIEKTEVPKPDKLQTEQQVDTKEAALSVPPNAKSAHATHDQKRSRIAATQNKSTLPGGEHLALPKDIMGDISTFVNQMPVGDPKNPFLDRPVNIITLAGENRGACMQMGSNSSQAEGPVHIHRGYKINPDESAEATSDGDGSSEGMKSEDANAAEDQSEAYVNNNAQGINNSIVFNSSITERNPGVHMVVIQVPKEAIQLTGKTSPTTQNAEFNMARAEKHTYEPTVRRRCLRGLFLESSDSDTENPKKPQRHGCRVSCQQQSGKGGQ